MKCARDMLFCDATWSFVEVSWVLLIGSPILDNSCTKEKKKVRFWWACGFFVLYISNKNDIYELSSFWKVSILLCK